MMLQKILSNLKNNATVVVDSRIVQKGDIFFAAPSPHMSDHIAQAISLGASFIVTEDTLYEGSHFEHVDNVRLAFSKACEALYQPQPPHQVAVTGTNGKSSVCYYLYQLWDYLKIPCASLGTLGLSTSCDFTPPVNLEKLTTLGTLPFHQVLQSLEQSGIHHLCFEASSHGLDQYRIHGAHIQAACFTSFSQDHLDYHTSIGAYLDAKIKLFTEVLPLNGQAIVSRDTYVFDKMQPHIRQPLTTYGFHTESHVCIKNVTNDHDATYFTLSVDGKDYPLHTTIVGTFQLENIACAFSALWRLGYSIETLCEGIQGLKAPPGRLERIFHKTLRNTVVVDFAHTPEALQMALQALRPACKGKLWVVFGCGGDRDPLKRPLMGKVASTFADVIVITDDNPRTENSATIRQAVHEGCLDAYNIGGREEAIHFALKNMQDHDILLIAGKGHETHQIIGTTAYPFNDKDCVNEYANNL